MTPASCLAELETGECHQTGGNKPGPGPARVYNVQDNGSSSKRLMTDSESRRERERESFYNIISTTM